MNRTMRIFSATILTVAAGTCIEAVVASAQGARPRDAAPADGGASVTARKLADCPPGIFLYGAMSPDRRLVSGDPGSGDLAILDVATFERRRLFVKKGTISDSFEMATGGALSPDGKQIAFGWAPESGPQEIRLIGVDGANMRRLWQGAPGEWWQVLGWGEEGRSLVALGTSQDEVRLIVVSAAGGSIRPVKTFSREAFSSPALSPDGRYLSYSGPASDAPGVKALLILDMATAREKQANIDSGGAMASVWSPDGRHLFYTKERGSKRELWRQAIERGASDGSAELLLPDAGRITPLGFDRDGRLYAPLDGNQTAPLLARLDPSTSRLEGKPAPVSSRVQGRVMAPAWSPDGSLLAYVVFNPDRIGRGRQSLVVRNVATAEERELQPDLRSHRLPRWTRDGRSVVVGGSDAPGYTGFYAVDIADGRVTRIVRERAGATVAESMAEIWGHSPSPDGTALLYGRPGVGIIRHEMATGRETTVVPLSAPDTYVDELIPDASGERIAYLVIHLKDRSAPSEIRVSSVKGGTQVLYRGAPMDLGEPSQAILTPVGWTKDGRALLATGKTSKSDKAAQLWRLDLSGGPPLPTHLTADELMWVSLHPDGSQVVYVAGSSSQELWVIEHLPGMPAASAERRPR